jgi:hypothetical protein
MYPAYPKEYQHDGNEEKLDSKNVASNFFHCVLVTVPTDAAKPFDCAWKQVTDILVLDAFPMAIPLTMLPQRTIQELIAADLVFSVARKDTTLPPVRYTLNPVFCLLVFIAAITEGGQIGLDDAIDNFTIISCDPPAQCKTILLL